MPPSRPRTIRLSLDERPHAPRSETSGRESGDIWWADLGEPGGSEPGYRRPVLIVQGDAFNQSRLATVVAVVLTSNLKWAQAPGNVLLTAKATGLTKDLVANVTQLVTIDRVALTERAGRLRRSKLELILDGLDTMLGRHGVSSRN